MPQRPAIVSMLYSFCHTLAKAPNSGDEWRGQPCSFNYTTKSYKPSFVDDASEEGRDRSMEMLGSVAIRSSPLEIGALLQQPSLDSIEELGHGFTEYLDFERPRKTLKGAVVEPENVVIV